MLIVAYTNILESHHIIYINSKITVKPNHVEIETIRIIKIEEQKSNMFAALVNQNKFEYQVIFSTKLDKLDDYDQVLVENELYVNLNTNQHITESDFGIVTVLSWRDKQKIKNERFRLEIRWN